MLHIFGLWAFTTVGQSSRMTVKKDSQARHRHRHLHRHFQQATQNLELLHQGSLFLCGLGQWRFRLASLISSQRRRFSYCAQRDNARRGDEAFLFDVLHVCIAAGIWHVSTRQMVLSTAWAAFGMAEMALYVIEDITVLYIFLLTGGFFDSDAGTL